MGHVVEHLESGVARLTLASPPMNLLDHELVSELGRILERLEADPGVRAVVLHGDGGRAFSSGSDLNELARRIGQGRAEVAAKFERDERVFDAVASLPKPTVCAIEGLAFGGGLELAVCCDFIIAGDNARLALPEVRLGAFPGSGGTVRITRRIGSARARRMMMLGQPIDAPTAADWGLIDELAAPGMALARATELAHRLAAGPARALAACKSCIEAAAGPAADAFALSRTLAVDLAFSADLREGLAAFRERREPVFGGVVKVGKPGD